MESIITYDTTQFAMVFLLLMVMYFLYMGYGLKGSRGGWFLIFGGFFTISLFLMIVSTFEGIWWFASPGIILFAILVLKDGVIKAFYESKEAEE